MTALDWSEENFKGHKVADTTRKISLQNFEKTGGVDYRQQNFTALHRRQIYPAADINAVRSPANSTLVSPFKAGGAEQLRQDMTQSPRGISPTNSRLEFLLRAKEQRN